jgi:hypothetical protein
MTVKQLVLAAALAGFAAVLAGAPPPAAAQSTTTGAIQGQVSDAASGEHLAGVTIVATSPVLQGSQTAISDDNGFYKITELPPGSYLVTFYYNQVTLQRAGVTVGVNKTTPVFQAIKEALTGGEVVKITATAPSIDPTSTTQGITIDKNYLRNIPIPGRTFEDALGAAAGSQNDGVGIAFSGSSSLENQYFVDGVNTTGLLFGNVGTPVINDFIEEIDVVTGGYNAEYGRATGGVVNVVTKSGSNEIKGSVFGTIQPGALTAAAQSTPINAGSIDAVSNNAYQADVGFELGGPIILDRLWYFVGFAPQLSRTDITRTTKRQTDCRTVLPSGALSACDPANGDRSPDIDPATGFFITDTLDEEVRRDTADQRRAQVGRQPVGRRVQRLRYPGHRERRQHLRAGGVAERPDAERQPGLGRVLRGSDLGQADRCQGQRVAEADRPQPELWQHGVALCPGLRPDRGAADVLAVSGGGAKQAVWKPSPSTPSSAPPSITAMAR